MRQGFHDRMTAITKKMIHNKPKKRKKREKKQNPTITMLMIRKEIGRAHV